MWIGGGHWEVSIVAEEKELAVLEKLESFVLFFQVVTILFDVVFQLPVVLKTKFIL